MEQEAVSIDQLSFEGFKKAVFNDYMIAFQSRQASLLGRKEVLTGKAKFGIFGDGKEVPQVAMAKFFLAGDFYAGYYRDQTFAFATGIATLDQFFSQLYADPSPVNDPHSASDELSFFNTFHRRRWFLARPLCFKEFFFWYGTNCGTFSQGIGSCMCFKDLPEKSRDCRKKSM